MSQELKQLQSMLPIICFRDGSPALPDALSMTNSAISTSALVIETMEALTMAKLDICASPDSLIISLDKLMTVFLGDMGAGKTSLVLRFVKGQFSEYQVTLSYCIFLIYYMAISVGNGLTLFYVEGCRNQ
ncbi:hypothetical protein Ahy_B08g091377 isoform E [Arachis hypogaea]|uniref:Uncharacterized protein n=1 Tax=Arachis hypogaea TaxID=3818 RepID=A0A444Y213_ARAHY|nr:hypothetical protein Ahy_B08g091377 isoform E [Arachis hypogaea]